MDLYIYYRVRTENAHALRPRIEAMQERLAYEYGIVSALKRRPKETDGRQTWMEIYQEVPTDFEAALERALVRDDLHAMIDGQRNIEYFVDISSCA